MLKKDQKNKSFMILFISYDYKAFPINLNSFNIVGVFPKNFILT